MSFLSAISNIFYSFDSSTVDSARVDRVALMSHLTRARRSANFLELSSRRLFALIMRQDKSTKSVVDRLSKTLKDPLLSIFSVT